MSSFFPSEGMWRHSDELMHVFFFPKGEVMCFFLGGMVSYTVVDIRR